MKKRYIIPQVSIVQIMHELPIAGSGVTGNNGIGYGGVDTDGTLEPSVKEFNEFDTFNAFNQFNDALKDIMNLQ